MSRFDEDLSAAEWSAQERRDDIENAERDERDHRFREDDLETPEPGDHCPRCGSLREVRDFCGVCTDQKGRVYWTPPDEEIPEDY